MKIEFLGTSAAWPIPRLNCDCALCSSTDPKDKRKRSSVLVNDKLLLDAGYDIYEQIKYKDLSKLAAIAISHEHPDHTAGLSDLDHIYNHPEPLTLFINKNTWTKVRRTFLRTKELVLVEPFKVYTINDLTFTFLPVNHTDSSFGILISEKGKKFFYAPDMGSLPAETEKMLINTDLIAFDGSSVGPRGSTKGHQSMEEGVKLAKKLKARQTFFTHIGHLTLPYKEQEQWLNEKGANFHEAFDGLQINL